MKTENENITLENKADDVSRVGALVGLPNVLYQKEPNSIWYSIEKPKCSNCKKQVKEVLAIKLNEETEETYFCDECQPAAMRMAFALNGKLEFILIRKVCYEDNPLNKLKTIKKRREPIGLSLRFKVMQRDKFRCKPCGKDSRQSTLEIDHIIPVAAGGKTVYDNLQTLCFDCNRGKRTELM